MVQELSDLKTISVSCKLSSFIKWRTCNEKFLEYCSYLKLLNIKDLRTRLRTGFLAVSGGNTGIDLPDSASTWAGAGHRRRTEARSRGFKFVLGLGLAGRLRFQDHHTRDSDRHSLGRPGFGAPEFENQQNRHNKSIQQIDTIYVSRIPSQERNCIDLLTRILEFREPTNRYNKSIQRIVSIGWFSKSESGAELYRFVDSRIQEQLIF